jgi:hypothetical protein
VSYSRIGLGSALRGFGATSPTAGTYQDPNCPFSCWALGNILDMQVLGQQCWPCHNVCPPGQGWDLNNLVCSGSPSATNPEVVPTTAGAPSDNPCPSGQAWSEADGQCESTFNFNTILLYGGIALAVIVGGVVLQREF